MYLVLHKRGIHLHIFLFSSKAYVAAAAQLQIRGGIHIKFFLVYPRHTKYVGVYSFRFSVCPFVRMYVRSSFRHRVKVFAFKFIRPHILKTL